MQEDLFGIVGREGVLRSSELLAGLHDMRARDASSLARESGPADVRGEPAGAQALDVYDACRRLADQGAKALLLRSPRHQHLLPLLDEEVGIPVIGLQAVLPSPSGGARTAWRDAEEADLDRRLAVHAMTIANRIPRQPFRLGVVGGVGPAATVDFLSKVVRGTHAVRDQDHIKVLLEQNPQIPDRTAHLLEGGADPSVALYATCKRLERQGASAIAIPCNTAHVFLPRMVSRLRIPVVDMIAETLDHIVHEHGGPVCVGLLATTGTIQSGVYAAASRQRGLTLRTPSAAAQRHVMDAIYGPHGIKAGYTQGGCVTALLGAIQELVTQGARVVILGCTELPLVFKDAAIDVQGTRVALVDPTDVLARRCVALALA